MKNESRDRQHFLTIVRKFKTAILVTHGSNSEFHARPMEIAEIEDSGDIYFSTSATSPKIDEISAEPNSLIVLQSENQFAAIKGTATVTRDTATIARLWSEDWRVWFPKGKDDPSLRLIHFRAQAAEFWDRGGIKALAFAFKAAVSVAGGTTPEVSDDMNAKIKL